MLPGKVGAQTCGDIVDATRLKASRLEHPERLIAMLEAQLAADKAEAEPESEPEAGAGLGRIGALCCRSSTSYQIY